MKKTIYPLLCWLFVIILSFNQSAFAQNEGKANAFDNYFYLQPNLGLTQYFGDYNIHDFYNEHQKIGYGGILGYQFSPVFGLRGQFTAGKLYSERMRDHDVILNNSFWDGSLQLTVNFNELFAKYNPKRFLNVYAFTGPGFSSFKTEITKLSTGAFVAKTDGRQGEFILPIGIGTSFRLSDNLHLNLEYGDRFLFTDNHLDLYQNIDIHDHYSYASLGLEIKFGKKDRDKDGIKDKDDDCPDTPGKVELAGCPDKDNDGIADKYDACPDVPGKAEFKGCPDTDGDGIPDKDDQCPTVAGLKQFNGCPDTDGDGIPDKDDRCPEVAGKAEFKGCPDRDGDGIPDIDDDCPDVKGLAQFKGCPDTDGDGVPDNRDKCPEVAGTIANNGCPEEAKALFDKVVYFDTDKWIVIANNKQKMDEIIQLMKDNPGIKVLVEGHTDSRESEQYNIKLSERRADYVIQYLTKQGIEKSRIVKKFYGESNPAAPNTSEEGMAKNRRVEIKSIK